MRKPTKEEIRRIYIIEVLLGDPTFNIIGINYDLIKKEFKGVLSQKDIITLLINLRSSRENMSKEDPSVEKKITILVSKTLRSLEEDGIITRTPKKIPGKRGPAQFYINLNQNPETLYKILKEYDNPLFMGFEWFFKHNLVNSQYYNNIVNFKLINDLISSLPLPLDNDPSDFFLEDDLDVWLNGNMVFLDEKEIKAIYHITKTSPGALKTLFENTYENKILDKQGLMGIDEYKTSLIQEIHLNFINDIFHAMEPSDYKVDISISAIFKDNDDKEFFRFSNSDYHKRITAGPLNFHLGFL